MNAAGHYRAAERLLAGPNAERYNLAVDDDRREYALGRADNLAAAQVHATLALAGATFLAGSSGYELASGELADVLIGADE
jgi:hypothetical protein